MNYLITIIGPTAIGKTSLSIALAQHFGCEIISCDSRQFFKEMKIGTAVPSDDELAAAPHHFIQNKSILEHYSVGDFEKEALEKLDALFTKNNIQIMVGGSGLYVDAVLKGFDEFPDIEEGVRSEIKKNYEEKGISYLQDTLKELDINYYNFLLENNAQTLKNPQRLMRFVEVCIGTGKPYISFIKKEKKQRNFTPIVIGLESDREIMYNRINQRVDIMMLGGLLEEVKPLYKHRNLYPLKTVGYQELFAHYNEETDLFDNLGFAFEEIKQNTRRFAKRQMTWFKRTENTIWFDFETDRNKIIEIINSKIQNR
ncbi:tRNA (adenosine(37)-N6)-dimethylallyltransferase MiaA [Flavobacterium sp.]|uniref:tRNA (adenosine(37)-N6)-dimethylallyltransferase MiaA n=1 Tax=Flavobacterium sp. TaxID=239 RepID=UPI001B404AA8|nr:tRNA (adenosine(37)-N6)-dimethylallyltransferase MiaA [Flavobacterium sp.]MBP6127697.1 tRNA (adenosine(37)-N6)-dimethylallyltransferase MiaA [Flavobacterium sp.]